MIYAGIDAGLRKTGLVVMSHEPGSLLRIEQIEHIRMDSSAEGDHWAQASVGERLHNLYTELKMYLGLTQPDLVILEDIRVRGGGSNLDTYLIAAKAQEVADLAARTSGIPVTTLLAIQVRSRLNIKAKKNKVKAAVIARMNDIHGADLKRHGFFPLIGVQDDIADAAALAMMGPALAKQLGMVRG